MTKTKNKGRGTMIGAAILLLAFPLGAVLFSYFGLEQFKGIMSDIDVRDTTKVEALSIQTHTGRALSLNNPEDRLIFVHSVNTPCDTDCENTIQQLQRLQKVFWKEDKYSMLILTHFKGNTIDSSFFLKRDIDTTNWQIISNASQPIEPYLLQQLDVQPDALFKTISMIDKIGVHRKNYSIQNQADYKLLIKQAAYYINPGDRKANIEYKQNTKDQTE